MVKRRHIIHIRLVLRCYVRVYTISVRVCVCVYAYIIQYDQIERKCQPAGLLVQRVMIKTFIIIDNTDEYQWRTFS